MMPLTLPSSGFIIDENIRNILISKDAKNVEIIKPIVRGRDVQKYKTDWAGIYLLNTHNGCGTLPRIDVKKDYPTIWEYLNQLNRDMKGQIESRSDQGKHWTNLRNCAYLKEFDLEKIFWIELVDNGRFAYDSGGMYCEATTFFMTGESMKYLVALLNSKVINFYFSLICPTSGMGTNRWKKVYVKELPVPKISEMEQQPFTKLVDVILQMKNAGENTKLEEDEIDRLVYNLYNLTDEEIAMVEEYNKSS